MAKRHFALIGLIVLGSISAARYANADISVADNGCTVLSEIVRESVLRAAVIGDRFPVPDNAPDYAGTQSCGNTAAAVSLAFRASLIQMNIATRWSLLQPEAAVMCDSHDLRNCYPVPDPMGPVLPPSDREFVQNSWHVIRNAVMLQMPWGVGSDLSHFDAPALAARLCASIENPTQTGSASIGRMR